LKWNTSNFNLSAAVFNRNSSHLIDYVKWLDPWQAQNIQDVTTKVLKHNCFIALILMHFSKLQFGYSFIQNDIKESTFLTVFFEFTKASVCGSYNMQFLKNFTNTISYRYAERIAGDSYSVVDLGASYTFC
jgi:iron complex outermembrane receptor protein